MGVKVEMLIKGKSRSGTDCMIWHAYYGMPIGCQKALQLNAHNYPE